MSDINIYVKESFQNQRNTRWNKSSVFVFLSEIVHPEYKNQQIEYYNLIKKGLNLWNKIIGDKVKFVITTNKLEADIIVRFNRVTREAWGMCYYDTISNSEFKKLTVKLGLSNEYNGAKLSQNDKFVLILHEFGHALGLGHSNNNDIMCSGYYPEKDWITLNDIITVKILYKLPVGIYYNEAENKIEKLKQEYIQQYLEKKSKPNTSNFKNRNLSSSLNEIANIKLYELSINRQVHISDKCQKFFNTKLLKNYKNTNEES